LRGALTIALAQLRFRTFQAADGSNDKTHRAANLSARPAPVSAAPGPHLLEVVEGAHFRPEHVNDDVAGVDQDPVGLAHSFDADTRGSGLLQVLDHVIRNGSHVAL